MYTAVWEAIGYATLCWEPKPSGVFDSEKASKCVMDLLFKIANEKESTLTTDAEG